MAESRNSFLDAPSYERITTPTQRESISRRRRTRYAGGDGSSDPIRRLSPEERREQQRQQRLEDLQGELSDSGARLTESERQAVLSGEPVSDIRSQVRDRQTRQGFARLQRDLSRTGAELTESEREAILEGESPQAVRQQVEQRRGRTFASSRPGGFVTARGEEFGVSEGVSDLIEQRQEEGGFERVRREQQARQTQEFASQTGLGGVSLETGETAAVTPEGRFVGGASFEPTASVQGTGGAGRITESGAFVLADESGGVSQLVTPGGSRARVRQQTQDAPISIRESSGDSGFVSGARALGDQPGTGFTGRQAADVAGGFERGLTQNMFRSFDQLSGVTERGRQEFQQISGTTRGSRSAFAGGLFAGSVGQAVALRGAGQALGFVGRAAAPIGGRLAGSLWLGSSASRAAAGTVAATLGGAAITAPRFVSATRRGVETDSLGRELSLATLQTGSEAGLIGSGLSRGFGSARAARIGGAVDDAVPSFGSLSPLSRASPGQAAQLQVTRALPRPSTRVSSFASEAVSATPGSLAVRTTQRGVTGGAGRSREFISAGTGGFSVPGSQGNILTGDTFLRPSRGLRQQTLTFGPQRAGTSRTQPFPQVTAGAASNAARAARPSTSVRELYAGGSQSLLPDRAAPTQLSRSQLQRALRGRSRESVSAGLPRWLGSGSRGRDSFVDAARLPAVTDAGASRSLSEFTGRIQPAPRRPSRVVPDEPSVSSRPAGRRGSSFDRLVFSDPTGGVATTIGRGLDRFGPIGSLRRFRTSRFSSRAPRRTARTARPSLPRSRARGFAAGGLGGVATSSALRAFRSSRDLSRTAGGLDTASLARFDSREGFSFDVDFSPRFDTGTRSTQLTRQDQTQLQRQTPRITTGFDFGFGGGRTGGPGAPTPPPATPPPAVPDLQIPDFGLGGTAQGTGRGTQRASQFTPSLVAQVLDIRGPRPSGGLTGLEIRPVTFRGTNN